MTDRPKKTDQVRLVRRVEGGGDPLLIYHVQAKLFYAVTSHTPSEILKLRVRASRPNLGLQTWPKDEIRYENALIARNSLAEGEIRELNQVTDILLSVFADQLDLAS